MPGDHDSEATGPVSPKPAAASTTLVLRATDRVDEAVDPEAPLVLTVPVASADVEGAKSGLEHRIARLKKAIATASRSGNDGAEDTTRNPGNAAPRRIDRPEVGTPLVANPVIPPQNGRDEALGRIIEDAIRRELSGPTGERMTREIRSLVQREVRQALAARETE